VELESIPDAGHFDLSQKTREFTELHGQILACGSCLKNRSKSGSAVCSLSTMADLLRLVEESDKVLSFG